MVDAVLDIVFPSLVFLVSHYVRAPVALILLAAAMLRVAYAAPQVRDLGLGRSPALGHEAGCSLCIEVKDRSARIVESE